MRKTTSICLPKKSHFDVFFSRVTVSCILLCFQIECKCRIFAVVRFVAMISWAEQIGDYKQSDMKYGTIEKDLPRNTKPLSNAIFYDFA